MQKATVISLFSLCAALCVSITSSAMAQGVLCLGPIPKISINAVPAQNFCPGEMRTIAVSGTVDANYSGQITLSTSDCALAIVPTLVNVVNGTYRADLIATGPGFQRTGAGYRCTINAGSPNPATVTVGLCTYPVQSGVTVMSYNMKKPANCP